MNGSRSNTSGQTGRKSSLDALSRTIEGLEARIEGMVAKQSGLGRAGRHIEEPAETPVEETESPVSEIVRRQRMLEKQRTRLQSRLVESRTGQKRDNQPGATAPASDASQQTLRDIAEALVELRSDMKSEFKDDLTRELQALRSEIAEIRTGANPEPLPAQMREDLGRLAESIEQFGHRAGRDEDDLLLREVNDLRALVEAMPDQASFQTHRRAIEERLNELDPQTLRSEIVGFGYRLDEIRETLAGLPQTLPVADLGERIETLSAAVETLARESDDSDGTLKGEFETLDGRLDEITKAIVAVGTSVGKSDDSELLGRLESRMAGLSRQIDDLASDDTIAGLGQRLDQLTGLLEASLNNTDTDDLRPYLAEISTKIDALDERTVDDSISQRLDALAQRIDEAMAAPAQPVAIDENAFDRLEALVQRAETSAAATNDLPGIETLEARLSDIVRRLDDTHTAPQDNDAALQGLETQIAGLSELISRVSTGEGDGEKTIEPRLAAIEDHLATNDEYIIEAARQAAEAVVEAYGRNSLSSGGDSSGEMAAIAELAEDLRALEALGQKSEERTARAFDAVHDTLVKIAGHLEKLDRQDGVSRDERAEPADGPMAVDASSDTQWLSEDGDREGDAQDLEAHRAAIRKRQAIPPAQAAAEAAEFAANEDGDDVSAAHTLPAMPEASRTSFLAGLGRRVTAQRNEPALDRGDEGPRGDLDETPSIDPSDSFASVSPNEPLEPGSGAPDIDRIMQKVREAQAGGDNGAGRDHAGSSEERTDFIAAARRAAQAAAAEVETMGSDTASGKRKGLGSIVARRRRPILMAVGAVLLAVMSWPLVSTMLSGHETTDSTQKTAGGEPGEPAVAQNDGVVAAGDAGSQAQPAAAMQAAVAEEAIADPIALPDAGGSQPAVVERNDTATGATPDRKPDTPDAPVAMADGNPGGVAGSATQATDRQQTAALEPDAGMVPEATAAVPENAAAVPDEAEPMAPAQQASDDDAADISVPEGVGPASLRTAARKGEALALFEIGARYTEGRGTDVDLAKAAEWYEKAAERGFAPAQYRLANLYEKGNGVDRDVAKAKVWYRKAANQGNASAMHNLAVLYALGKEGKPDYDTASGWFRKAARLGVHDSQFNLGILYAQGNGVPKNLISSYKWFAVAAADGDADATQKRDQIAGVMSDEQLETARAQASDWKALPLDEKANTVSVPPEWNGTDTKTASVDMTKVVRNIQAILNNNGFDAGRPDGIMGEKTRSAIRDFQKSVGEEPTGRITDALVKELLQRNG